MAETSQISLDQAKKAHDEAGFRGEVHLMESVPSTNSSAKELVEGGAEEGTLVIAGEQTRGRGRLERGWHSPPGGLYMSLVLGPFPEEFPASLVPLAAGVALAVALEEHTGMKPSVKWPNDVLAGEKKLAGILAESVEFPDNQTGAVLGVGVNVNIPSFPEDIAEKTTSILLETGRDTTLAGLLGKLLVRLKKLVSGLYRGERSEIVDGWRRLSATTGRLVIVDFADGSKVYGKATDIDNEGALILETDTGFSRVLAGDVFHLHTQKKETDAQNREG